MFQNSNLHTERFKMNSPPTETPAVPFDPATLTAMHSTLVGVLPPRPGASEAEKTAQREGALAFFAALLPRDAVQAMLAAHIVASHYAAMECFRRAACEVLSLDMHLRMVAKAVALCRMIEREMNDLARRQGIPARRPVTRPAAVPAALAQPAPEAVRASTPAQPPVVENRHERHRRERAERHLAAAARRAGLGKDAVVNAMQERLVAEVTARAAASPVVAAA
jgi:hypothetical protein